MLSKIYLKLDQLSFWKTGQSWHDYINLKDFPVFWLNLDITVEIEAKAKELAVLKLMREIDIKQNKLSK